MARFHAEQSRSLLDAAKSGHLSLVRELLVENPACIEERSPDGNGPLHELTNEASVAQPLIGLLLAHGADPDAKNVSGGTPARRLEELGADEVADLLETMRGDSTS